MAPPTHLKRVLLTVLLCLAGKASPSLAQIVETQNLGTFGSWRAYRDLYPDNTWTCVVETFASNRPETDNTTLYAYPSHLAFGRSPDLAGNEDATFLVEDIIFPMYISASSRTAYTHDEDDFLAMFALAQTRSGNVEVVIKNRTQVQSFLFPTRGFREAYRIIGQACDFDTTLILEAR